MYKNVIFDADGTVINSYKDIAESICWALKKCGYPEPSNNTLRKFIGPSIHESLTKTIGVAHEDVAEIIRLYRERYKEQNHRETRLYEGYPELFEKLQKAGVRMSVASSKPERFLLAIFEKLSVAHYFEKIAGAHEDDKTSDKASIVKKAILDKSVIMVGDRKFDIIAASDLKIDSIGVTYGFMEKGEFDVYRPTYLADTTEDIYNIVTND